jgi:hypothetical protein
MKKFTACAAVMLIISNVAVAGTWEYFNYPGASSTVGSGIRGNIILGEYGGHGFKYDGTNWTTLDYPNEYSTTLYDIQGNTVVGTYRSDYGSTDHGFIYDGTNWMSLDVPGGSSTQAYAIEGDNVVGYYSYYDNVQQHRGFKYNLITQDWILYDFPILKIHGDMLLGSRNRIYDGMNWTTFSHGNDLVEVLDFDGNRVVGEFWDNTGHHGFLYDGTTWTTIDNVVGGDGTAIWGISGDKLLGVYWEENPTYEIPHGFVYTIPEPATILLLGLGGVMIRKVKSKK